jgi:O-antigen ligase
VTGARKTSSWAQSSGSGREHAAPNFAGLFVAFVALVAWAPIPLGSNRAWSSALLGVLALSMLGVWLTSYALRPFSPHLSIYRPRWIVLLLAAWACYPLVQLIPLTDAVLEWLSPGVHGYYGHAANVEGEVARFLTIDRGATLWSWLWHSSQVAVFLLVLMLLTTPARLRTMLIVIVAVGTLQALYGIVVYLGGDHLGLWDPRYSTQAVSGTYVNPNHFAGLMEITLCAAAGLVVTELSRPSTDGATRHRVLSASDSLFGWWTLLAFAVLIMCAGLLLSASRGALVAITTALLASCSLSVWFRGMRAPEARLLLGAATVAMVAALWLGASTLVEKMQARGLQSNRPELRELSYEIIHDNPLFGAGAGTYRWILPLYKDERFGTAFYEHAHNDYLELLGDEGIIGFALIATGVLLILRRLVIGLSRRRDPLMRGVLFAAFSGALSLLIHGLVGFNLQIPANATYFFLMLGLGLVATQLRDEKRE